MRGNLLQAAVAAGLAVFALAGRPAAADAPPNRLALVIGQASYGGDALPTAANDAALVARTLATDGFDVTELHDLNTPDLNSSYRAFLEKVKSAPPGAAVTVYLSGLGVAVGCDDFLLPVDAQIQREADVPRIALSMTHVMADLADTGSLVRLLMLDAARPIPSSVSAVNFPRGLIPLDPPTATAFALSAEVHDFEDPPRPGDANGAYASAFSTVAQQPFPDLETTMREVRVFTHQTTSGAQTPWNATNLSMPPFTFPVNADPNQVQAAIANLPNSSAPIARLDAGAGYWAAISRNTAGDYQAFLDAFSKSASSEVLSRIKTLRDLLSLPNPVCEGSAPASLPLPAPRPAPAPAPAPEGFVSGPACPEGFAPEDGYNGAYCAPLAPPPVLECPPGFVSIGTDDGLGCAPLVPPPTLFCPPGYRVFGSPPYCAPDRPPVFCPPDFRPVFRDGQFLCVRRGPPPPLCPPGAHPRWNGNGYVCERNPPPPILCPNGRAIWDGARWTCIRPPPPRCPIGQFPQWIDGRETCGREPPPRFGGACPPGFVRGGENGLICVPVRNGPVLIPPVLPVPPPGGCRPGEVNINGRCEGRPGGGPNCLPGEVSIDGRCERRPGGVVVVCQPGEVNIDGRCERRPGQGGACPPGQVRGGNGCEPMRPDNRPNVGPIPAPVVIPKPIVTPIPAPVVVPRPIVTPAPAPNVNTRPNELKSVRPPPPANVAPPVERRDVRPPPPQLERREVRPPPPQPERREVRPPPPQPREVRPPPPQLERRDARPPPPPREERRPPPERPRCGGPNEPPCPR